MTTLLDCFRDTGSGQIAEMKIKVHQNSTVETSGPALIIAVENGKFHNETRVHGIWIKRVYMVFLMLYDEKYESNIVRN